MPDQPAAQTASVTLEFTERTLPSPKQTKMPPVCRACGRLGSQVRSHIGRCWNFRQSVPVATPSLLIPPVQKAGRQRLVESTMRLEKKFGGEEVQKRYISVNSKVLDVPSCKVLNFVLPCTRKASVVAEGLPKTR